MDARLNCRVGVACGWEGLPGVEAGLKCRVKEVLPRVEARTKFRI